MSDDELDLIPTDTLMEALHRRSGGAIVVSMLIPMGVPGGMGRGFFLKGGYHLCWGLASDLVEHFRRESTGVDPIGDYDKDK